LGERTSHNYDANDSVNKNLVYKHISSIFLAGAVTILLFLIVAGVVAKPKKKSHATR